MSIATCGKVERFHQTLAMAGPPARAETFRGLQGQLDALACPGRASYCGT